MKNSGNHATRDDWPDGPVWAVVLPNVLTGLRFGLAITFPLIPPRWRLPIVLLAAASDGLDGWIARRFRGTSWIGGLLDAAADKAFVLIVLFTALAEGRLSGAELALLLPRDMVVALMALGAVLARRWTVFRRIPARRFGKWTTAALFALFVLLVVEPHWPTATRVLPIALTVTSLVSMLAAIDYAIVAWRLRGDGSAGAR